ncbi:MAG: TonB-dependent receptor [Hydrogenophaga sp.]|nr:TonB-dependent receptor [Hydrogenophaga sp.]
MWPAWGALSAGAGLGQTLPVEPGALAPVVVTGSSVYEQRWRGSASIDVVEGEELRSGQLQINLSEGMGRVPGLVIRNRNNYAQDLQVSVRGFGARSTFGVRGVRLFVDGIPASAPDGAGQAANFPLSSAQRIEVVRGPLATLYGASSGAAILLYTEDGGEPAQWRGGLALGDHGLWRLSTQLSGRVGASTGGDSDPGWLYALDTGRFETDGLRPQSSAHRSTTNAKLVRAHDGGRTVLLFNRQTGFALDPQGLTRAQFDADPTQTASQAIDFNTRKSVSQAQAGVAWDHALGGGHSLELMGYAGQRHVMQFQSIPPTAQNAATSSGGVIDLDRVYQGLNARWRWQGTWGSGRADLSAGLAVDHQSDLRLGFNNFTGPSGAPTAIGVQGLLRRDETNRATTRDPYLRASYSRDAFTVEGGVRHIHADYRSSDRFLSNGDDSGAVSYARTVSVLGARWQLDPDLQLYGSLGQGFEIPTLNEVAYQSSGATGLNTALRPSRSSNAELGLRGRHADGLWSATLFHTRTRDEIVVDSSSGGRTVYTNAGRTERRGVELSAEHAWGDLVFTSAWTWLQALYLASADARFPAGNALPGVPAQQLFAQLAWTPPWARAVGGVFSMEARHTGRVYVNDLNTDAAGAHTLLSLGARFEQRVGPWTWRQFVRIDNLTDRRHAGSVIVNDGNGRYFEPGAGRSWSAGLELARRF